MKNWKTPKGYVEKKYNYTYKLTFKNDERYYYYGVHCTNLDPENDGYYGSGSNVKEYHRIYGKDCFNKKILEFFPTKKEALLAEDKLVPIEILNDEFCLNKIQGGGTFDTTGMKMNESHRKSVSERFKGVKRTKESINKMIETRRMRGTDKHSDETKQKLSEIQSKRTSIHKDGICKRVNNDDLEYYTSNGWSIGYTEERNKKVSIAKMGENNPNYGKSKPKDVIEKMLETKRKNNSLQHSDETKQKLTDLNRRKANDPEFRKRLSEACKGVNTWSKGRIFIKKDGKEITCKLEDLDTFLNDGWVKGRINKVEREYYKTLNNKHK